MKKTFLVILISSLLFASCDLLWDILGGLDNTKEFYALDYTTEETYRIYAEKLAENSLCEIWVEMNGGVSRAMAENVANTYRTKIYPKMLEYFGWEAVENGQRINVMQIADLLSDGNGKLTILILDIKDYFKNNGSYVGGYFRPIDLFTFQGSNSCDIITLDSNPQKVGSDDFYETLAHEMQHLMNFVSSMWFRLTGEGENTNLGLMDTWIDEGLSALAEWVYSNSPSESRVKWYNEDETGLIAKGDNFYLWDNNQVNPRAVLNDYSTVSIFFQWLRLQENLHKKSKVQDVFKDMIQSEFYDYQAVQAQFKSEWKDLLEMWHTANFDPAYAYGYKNERYLKDIKNNYLKDFSDNNKDGNGDYIWPLFPGEAVYSYSASSWNITPSNHDIRYKSLFTSAKGNALLTFNSNTETDMKKVVSQDGFVSGQLPPVSSSVNIQNSSQSRFVNRQISGPYKIDGRDLLNRKGYNNDISRSLIRNNERNKTVKENILSVIRSNILKFKESLDE